MRGVESWGVSEWLALAAVVETSTAAGMRNMLPAVREELRRARERAPVIAGVAR